MSDSSGLVIVRSILLMLVLRTPRHTTSTGKCLGLRRRSSSMAAIVANRQFVVSIDVPLPSRTFNRRIVLHNGD